MVKLKWTREGCLYWHFNFTAVSCVNIQIWHWEAHHHTQLKTWSVCWDWKRCKNHPCLRVPVSLCQNVLGQEARQQEEGKTGWWSQEIWLSPRKKQGDGCTITRKVAFFKARDLAGCKVMLLTVDLCYSSYSDYSSVSSKPQVPQYFNQVLKMCWFMPSVQNYMYPNKRHVRIWIIKFCLWYLSSVLNVTPILTALDGNLILM